MLTWLAFAAGIGVFALLVPAMIRVEQERLRRLDDPSIGFPPL